MQPAVTLKSAKSRLAVLLDHFARIKDPRNSRRIIHPLCEVLLLVVCGTIADCDDSTISSLGGEAHLDFLRRYAPFAHSVPRLRTQLIHHLKSMASVTVARKFLASLSYRVATQRQSFKCEKARSITLRPL
jgi:hypothetical protein